MDIYKTELFPYIQGDAMVGKHVTLTMTRVVEEELNNQGRAEVKYVVYFKETDKGLILNKTNAGRIVGLYGRETNDWSGKQITLYTESVTAFGATHNAVRVDKRKPAPAKNDKPAPVEDPFPGKVDSDHPDPAAEMDNMFPDDEPAPAGNNYSE